MKVLLDEDVPVRLRFYFQKRHSHKQAPYPIKAWT